MARISSAPAWSYSIDTELIDVTSSSPTPNERWRFTDANGHEHHYDKGYPSLSLVIDESHWCLGNEGVYAHDPHEAVDRSHYQCRICGEVIEPTLDPPFTRKQIPRLRTCTAWCFTDDGRKLEFWLPPEELEAAIQSPDPRVALIGIIEAHPERIIAMTAEYGW
jgi:hypothetical protein